MTSEKKLKNKLEYIRQEIVDFKLETKRFTKWDTGYNILNFIATRRAFEYGKLIGKENILDELTGGEENANKNRNKS